MPQMEEAFSNGNIIVGFSDFQLRCDLSYNICNYTANVNSKIADKLRYLLVNSKQKHIFSDIFESC